MAAKMDEIVGKYGLKLHQSMEDVPGREAWLELLGSTFLAENNTGYSGTIDRADLEAVADSFDLSLFS